MSEILRSVLLGIIQGLTEFLPVSSSGHLELAEALLGETAVGETSLLFAIVVHVATALATLYVFRHDVLEILGNLFRRDGGESRRFAIHIVISMIPAAVVGFTAEPLIERLFDQRVLFVGCMLIITAVLLFLADRARTVSRPVKAIDAVLVGIAQAFALLPGISRSGATIATSVMLGIDRYKASRFSFLMVVPLILGKMGYDLITGGFGVENESWLPLICGFVAAFVSGALACRWMIALVRKSKLTYFAVYCVVVGGGAVIWMLVS